MQGPKNGVIIMMAAPVVFASSAALAVSFMALNASTKHLQPREGRQPQFRRHVAKNAILRAPVVPFHHGGRAPGN